MLCLLDSRRPCRSHSPDIPYIQNHRASRSSAGCERNPRWPPVSGRGSRTLPSVPSPAHWPEPPSWSPHPPRRHKPPWWQPAHFPHWKGRASGDWTSHGTGRSAPRRKSFPRASRYRAPRYPALPWFRRSAPSPQSERQKGFSLSLRCPDSRRPPSSAWKEKASR